MTNVPGEIREIWTELYKLFDRYYMFQDTQNGWKAYWTDAVEICKKHEDRAWVKEFVFIISDIIGERIKNDACGGGCK